MYVDYGILGAVLTFAVIGLFSGFWGQCLRLVALGSLYFVAPPVARRLEPIVAEFFAESAPPLKINGVSLIVAAVGLYVVMSLVIWVILRATGQGKSMSGANRLGGFVLGALKGTALAYLLLCGLVLVAHSAHYSDFLAEVVQEDWEVHVADSEIVRWVSWHNLLDEMGYELPTPQEIEDTWDELTNPVEPDADGVTPEPGPEPAEPVVGDDPSPTPEDPPAFYDRQLPPISPEHLIPEGTGGP